MKQLLWLLLVGLGLGLGLLPVKLVQCSELEGGTYSTCYNTTTGRTCLTTFITKSRLPVRRSYEDASHWCKTIVPGLPGSSLIVIKSAEDQQIVERFIYEKRLENETIITDARRLFTNDSRKWSWVDGDKAIPEEVIVAGEKFPEATGVTLNLGTSYPAYNVYEASLSLNYICEYSDSKLGRSFRLTNKSYVASEGVATWFDARKNCLRLKGDLASITDLRAIKNWSWLTEDRRYWIGLYRINWIWNNTGVAATYTNWDTANLDKNHAIHCICITPRCRVKNHTEVCAVEHNRVWRTCNCSYSYAVVCQRDEERSDVLITEITAPEEKLPTTSADIKAPPYVPVNKSLTSISRLSSTLSKTTAPISTKRETKESSTLKTTASWKTPTPLPTYTTINRTTKSFIAATITTTTLGKSANPIVTDYALSSAARYNTGKTASTPFTNLEPSSNFSDGQTTASSPSTGLFHSFSTKEIILVLILLLTVVLLVVASILIVRKRRYGRQNEESSTKDIKQNEEASAVYATVVPVNSQLDDTVLLGNTIYTDVEMTQRPTPSDTIYASVQPIGEAMDTGNTVVNAELSIQQKTNKSQ